MLAVVLAGSLDGGGDYLASLGDVVVRGRCQTRWCIFRRIRVNWPSQNGLGFSLAGDLCPDVKEVMFIKTTC